MPGLRFRVLDTDRQPLHGGLLVVCPGPGDCRDLVPDDEGWVTIPSELVLHNRTLSFFVHDDQGRPLFARTDWPVTEAERRVVATDPRGAYCRLVGTVEHSLEVEISARPGGAEAPSIPAPATPNPQPPRSAWSLSVGAGWQLGDRFTEAPTALGGVESVSAGPWVSLQRHRGRWVFGAGYALNRYRVQRADAPGEGDLGFHRLGAACGLLSARGPWCLALLGVVNYGGIYDGSARLVYEGRTYGMPGAGLRAELSRGVWTQGRRSLGVMLRLEMIHYLADESDNDHWYGTAPGVGVGLVLRSHSGG